MARSREMSSESTWGTFQSPVLISWAEMVGEALGRGVARGLNSALPVGPRHNGHAISLRPNEVAVSGARRCKASGCTNTPRALGLCSAHYQAARRRTLARRARA